MASSAPIVVLGGSGFIGTRLVSQLTRGEANIRIGDLQASEAFPALHYYCDVLKSGSMAEILSGAGVLVNLAAEHRDDVRPVSRYHQTNVEGAREVCVAATTANIKTLVFTSSVAVYGLHPFPVGEDGPLEPFNPYGETKLQAESIYRDWAREDPTRSLVIIRPTVVFGEGNRGNVYNLFQQIAQGRFLMVGSGRNKKSMAYVDNVCGFIRHCFTCGPGIHLFNYTDGPDLDMNHLVPLIETSMGRTRQRSLRIPYPVAYLGGLLLDGVSHLVGRTFPISAVRIKKFCSNTQFLNDRARATGYLPLVPLDQAIKQTVRSEFSQPPRNT